VPYTTIITQQTRMCPSGVDSGSKAARPSYPTGARGDPGELDHKLKYPWGEVQYCSVGTAQKFVRKELRQNR
jgi:hypothetical protein